MSSRHVSSGRGLKFRESVLVLRTKPSQEGFERGVSSQGGERGVLGVERVARKANGGLFECSERLLLLT
jgi:hypothetical protein